MARKMLGPGIIFVGMFVFILGVMAYFIVLMLA